MKVIATQTGKQKFGQMVKQAGYSMLELMVIVVILGIIASFVVPMLTGVKDKNVTVQQEFNAMQRTVTQIYDRYFNEIIDDTNVDNTEIITAKLQSEAYKNDGASKLFNIFGGEIIITGVADNGLIFESQKIPTNVCSSMVSMTRGKMPFESVSINGGADILFSDDDAIQQISAACDIANDTLTIIWTKDGA